MEETKLPERIKVTDRTNTNVRNAMNSYNSSNFELFVKTWTKIVLMLGGLFLAILAAVGHHLFYNWLDWQDAGSNTWQAWVDHTGNAFMFLVRFFLSLALGIALLEIMWMYARIRTLSIQGLDSMFVLNNSILDFLSWELFTKAKGVMLVALIFWLLPIGVLPTTGSIQVTPRWKDKANCIVRGLDFNQTFPKSEKDRVTYLAIPNNSTYHSYTTEAYRIITTVAFSGSILNFASPCSTGQCNYTLNLVGPAMKCENKNWQDKEAPWYQSDPTKALFNVQNPWYYYQGTAPESPSGGANGTFWAAWAYADDDEQTLSPNGIPYLDLGTDKPFSKDSRYTLKAMKCTDYMADYKLHVTFTYNVMIMKVLSTNYLYPIDYTKQNEKGNWGNFAIFELLFRNGNTSTVAGDVIQTGKSVTATGKIMNTNLVEANVDRTSGVTGYLPVRNLGDELEELYKNITLSLLSHDDLVYATNPEGGCSIYPNTWVYNEYGRMVLWLCYGISVIISTVIVVFGLIALRHNDPMLEFSFSGILKATRNPELDELIDQNNGSLDGVKLKLDSRGRAPDPTVERSDPEEAPPSGTVGSAVRYSFLVADSAISPKFTQSPRSPQMPPGNRGSGAPSVRSGGYLSPRATSPLMPHHPGGDDTIKEESSSC